MKERRECGFCGANYTHKIKEIRKVECPRCHLDDKGKKPTRVKKEDKK